MINQPRTEAQIEASRANGSLSRGPITEEGKAISSRNAVKHGLLSTRAILPGEEQEEFERILAAALDKYRPLDDEERFLVSILAMNQWRELRVWAMQLAAHAGEILSQEEAPPDLPERDMAWRAWEAYRKMHLDRRCIEIMHRYETAFENKFYRARRELMGLKAKREEPNVG